MATKDKVATGSAMDRAAQTAGLNVRRELEHTVAPDINERLDLRVGEHIIAKLVTIKTQNSNNEQSRKSTFKIYVLEDSEGTLWDLLGSADLDGRRELPGLTGHMIGIERVADEAMSANISPKKKYRVVDYGVTQS